MFYVYALIDTRANLPFYIGKGKQDNQRHMDHFKESIQHNTNRAKVFKIKFLRDNGFDIPVRYLAMDIEDELQAYAIENFYIRKYGRQNIDENGILTNICLDALPPNQKGKPKSQEHVRKVVEASRRTKDLHGPYHYSEERRTKLSDMNKGEKNRFYGKTHSKEFSEQHSKRMTGNINGAKIYLITDPIGNEFIVKGKFQSFYKEHKLSIASVEKTLYKGIHSKRGSWAGWDIIKLLDHVTKINRLS